MEGKQKEIYEALEELAGKIRDGAFGTDYDVDTDAIESDLYAIVDEVF